MTIETATYTGPLKTIRCHGSKTQALSRSDCFFSWLSSTFQHLQELNGRVILDVETCLRGACYWRVDHSHKDLGLMKVSRARFSALVHRRLRAAVFTSSLFFFGQLLSRFNSRSTSPSTSSANCCELACELPLRPERRFGSVARVRCLASSLSSGMTPRRPYQQLLQRFARLTSLGLGSFMG